MAVSEQTPYKEYTANGSANSFALEFDCENQDHLIVLVDDVKPVVGTWSLIGGAVVFGTAPINGKKITIQRNTPVLRSTNFQSFNNSLRPDAINKDLDRVWLRLQEEDVAKFLLNQLINMNYEDLNEKGQNIRTELIDELTIQADELDQKIQSTSNQLNNQIIQQGVSQQQLQNYYLFLLNQMANLSSNKNWLTSLVVDASGKSQQEINNAKSIEYLSGVTRYNGLVVKTTSYHLGLNIGGNTYKYDTSISRLSHNGGTHIDPTKTFPVNWADKTQQQAWFTATSDLMGVFVLVKPDTDLCASDFGVHPEKDSTHAIQSAVNYSEYRTVIYADVVINSSETLQIKNGCGLVGGRYTHNSRSTLKTGLINYTGVGDAVKFGESVDSARCVTFKNIHAFDVAGTARCAVIANKLIGSDVDFVATGFEATIVVQNYLYYINKFKVFGYNYRKNGILIGGNINEGHVEFKLVSASLEIQNGFLCGFENLDYGVIASASNNPTITGSVEQDSGRHFDFQQIRGGFVKPYFESPGATYQNIQMNINRCYGTHFEVYGSGKSLYTAWMGNSRDCKIAGELKGGATADLNIANSCSGINTSELHSFRVAAANHTTGGIIGRASNGHVVRESFGVASSLPTVGGYGISSKLWHTNPTSLPDLTVVTDITIDTTLTPNTMVKTTAVIKRKEIGKLVTVAGSFGTLASTTVSGETGSNIITINFGANNILVGDYLSIPNNSGSSRIDYIYQDGGVTKARINRNLENSISAVAVTYFAPTVEPIIVTTQ